MPETRNNTPEMHISIDLGTTHTVSAYQDRHGKVVTIPNANDELADITFEYDSSGLPHVHAVKATLRKEASATIDRLTGLNNDCVHQSMLKIKRFSVL